MNSNQNTLIQNRSYFWAASRDSSFIPPPLNSCSTKILMNLIFDIDFWKKIAAANAEAHVKHVKHWFL